MVNSRSAKSLVEEFLCAAAGLAVCETKETNSEVLQARMAYYQKCVAFGREGLSDPIYKELSDSDKRSILKDGNDCVLSGGAENKFEQAVTCAKAGEALWAKWLRLKRQSLLFAVFYSLTTIFN